MADTIRERIIAAFVTRLAAWTAANGFHYSCGSNANRAVYNIEEGRMPACGLWPQPETAVQIPGRNVCEMPINLEAWTDTESGINPSVIQEKLLGDAIQIMTDPSVSVTSLINGIYYTGGGAAGTQQGEERTVGIVAKFLVKYKTALGNPYSQ